MRHVGKQVGVGGGFFLEELAEQELLVVVVVVVRRSGVSHGLGSELGVKVRLREIEDWRRRARKRDAKETDTKHCC